ncbi:MAG: reverse transcriptase domain-containing protein [Candidatus Pacebacteria bacterium]|nr:reverse transcriptase domain-containing protein [Candidatus Paceibacterota bacterium]
MNVFPENAFDLITSSENITHAYTDLVRKFDEESKAGRYRGVDGIKLNTLNFSSTEEIPVIRQEMRDLKKIRPAYMQTIPKKNGKKRKIFVYSIKERIKAEAIYRVLLPFFDSYFSPFLFSYRSSHPSYYAARSATRRYKRYYGEDHVLVTDISDYADTIDHDILLKKLLGLGLDARTLRLLELFIKTNTLEDGVLIERPRGVLTGTPLYALLSNFYMDDFDKWAGKSVALYRRVGDDIIAMDKDAKKVAHVGSELAKTVQDLKVRLNTDKAKLIPSTQPFKFLGYSFRAGKISFDESSRNKALASWKRDIFSSRAKSVSAKMKHIRSLIMEGTDNFDNQFTQLIDQKRLVDDDAYMKQFSEKLFHMLTVYFKGRYTPKNRREVEPVLRKTGIRSLFEYYREVRYPKKHV